MCHEVNPVCHRTPVAVALTMDSEQHESPGHNPYPKANILSKSLFW